ncbi:hypothetical protein VUR80DRAFT_2582 [Thermomyces stellatus]
MNILDLPWDILYDIFLRFRDPRVRAEPGEPGWCWMLHEHAIHDEVDSARIQTIKNARLTCRLFNRAASPHLVPWIRVSVNRTSLAKVDAISRNPHIASGVRAIKLDASYYPKELAEDIERFAERQRHDLQDEDSYMSTYFGEGEDEEEARANCAFIIKAWVNALSATAAGTGGEKTTEYQTLLRDVHGEFRRRHEEVSGLVADGSFVKALAQSISRLPAFSSLMIDDKNPRSTRDMHDPLHTFNDRASLVNFLVSPFLWSDIEKAMPGQALSEGGMELAVASLLRDLPIAIHQAGGILRDLSVWVFPRRLRNRTLLDPEGREQEIRDAFQHLEQFQLIDHGSRAFRGEANIPPERLGPSDRYLKAVVSSPHIRSLRLHFPRQASHWSRYPASSFIPAVASDRLTVLALEGALVRQSDLNYLCSRLALKPTFVELSALTLQSGRWSPVVDAVRRRTEALCAQKKCRVRLSKLVGGEFGEIEKKCVCVGLAG